MLTAVSEFLRPGKASVIIGGQFGSEGKGAAAAWLGAQFEKNGIAPDVVTTNASAQAGHTSIHNGKKRVVFHLPTVPLISGARQIICNAGCAIDPIVLAEELADNADVYSVRHNFFVHPNAAIITDECRAAEGAEDSAQTKVSSTRKGVGEALARKALRSGMIAKDHMFLRALCLSNEYSINVRLQHGNTVLVEVPQGHSLSQNGPFYPYCTSRDCSIMQGLNDAGIHPSFYHTSMLVLRTYPIRVGSLPGHSSGDVYPDQKEITWEELGVEPEITTVTKRIRRVFTWSSLQVRSAIAATRPSIVFLTHCDYVDTGAKMQTMVDNIRSACNACEIPQPYIVYAEGPTTDDIVRGHD